MSRSLKTCLQASRWHHLRTVARTLGLKASSNASKGQLIETLEEALVQPQPLTDCLRHLSSQAHDILRALVILGDEIPYSEFAHHFGLLHPRRPQHALSPAEELYHHGLIYLTTQETPHGRQEHVVLPKEILQLLPSPHPLPFAASLTTITPLNPLPIASLSPAPATPSSRFCNPPRPNHTGAVPCGSHRTSTPARP